MYPVWGTFSGIGEMIMSKSAMIRARLEPELKENAETVLRRLGLNATQAITMFYKQVELRGGLPFDVVMPTPTTKRTLDATDAGRNLVLCEDADDMFDKLAI
jgi:DNA-damage-inducible protein J